MIIMALSVANMAHSDARFLAETQAPNALRHLVYAEASVDSLSDSDMRRLVFYANRSNRALQLVVEGAEARDTEGQRVVNNDFRASLARLADAGARSGLSLDQVADFYTETVFDHFGQGFIQRVSSISGGLDFRSLFRVVSSDTDPQPDSDHGAAFLNALATESTGLALQTFSAPPAATKPSPLPNATAAEIAVVNRIKVTENFWALEVEAGDSLSEIASAIYGDSLSFAVLFEANRDVILDANILEVGTVIRIPKPQSTDGSS